MVDLLLAELPAEEDFPPAMEREEIDKPEVKILGYAAHALQLLEVLVEIIRQLVIPLVEERAALEMVETAALAADLDRIEDVEGILQPLEAVDVLLHNRNVLLGLFNGVVLPQHRLTSSLFRGFSDFLDRYMDERV